jgi:hypothetical protein
VREFAALPEVVEASVLLTTTDPGADTTDAGPVGVEGYRYDNVRMDSVRTATETGLRALARGIAIVGEPPRFAAIPIVLRGRGLGVVEVTFQRSRLPDETVAMLKQASERLATALENARLLQNSLRQAEKERLIGDIAAKIGGSISMRNVLQTAVEELGHAIPGTDVTIRLRTEGTAPAGEAHS